VLGPGGTVEEIPRAEEPLLAVDEQPAFPGQDEERFLLRLGVVEAVRLVRLEDGDVDPCRGATGFARRVWVMLAREDEPIEVVMGRATRPDFKPEVPTGAG
jgi:hypothetical protein